MSKDRQRIADYLEHMLKAIERVVLYAGELDEAAFSANALVHGTRRCDTYT